MWQPAPTERKARPSSLSPNISGQASSRGEAGARGRESPGMSGALPLPSSGRKDREWRRGPCPLAHGYFSSPFPSPPLLPSQQVVPPASRRSIPENRSTSWTAPAHPASHPGPAHHQVLGALPPSYLSPHPPLHSNHKSLGGKFCAPLTEAEE